MTSTYNNVTVSANTSVSYIAAGDPSNPVLLLLHGFPSSSNQFRNLIPLLSSAYYVLAPDLPGYGLTTVPSDFTYTFASLTTVIGAFLSTLKITSFTPYLFDYGAPVGLRLALKNPSAIKAIITQNGNAYVEGFGHPFWDPIFALWNSSNATPERDYLRANILTLETTKYQYVTGVPTTDLPLIDPVAYTYDYLQNEAGKKQQEIQLDLLYDYRTNVELYPQFQKFLRDSKVPVLAVWGKGDPAFIPPGAEAFKKDAKNPIVKFVDAGHFALETKVKEIAADILSFLKGLKHLDAGTD